MYIYYKYLLIILLILLIFLTIYHIKFYYKYHNTYEISQLDFNNTDYTKEIIDNIIYDKKLAIIILHEDDNLIGNKEMFLKDTILTNSEKKIVFPKKYLKELGFLNLALSSPLNYNILSSLEDVKIGLINKNLILNSKVSINENKEEFCVICQDNILEKQIIRTLKCLHSFDLECIDNWLINNKKCPTCKFEI